MSVWEQQTVCLALLIGISALVMLVRGVLQPSSEETAREAALPA